MLEGQCAFVTGATGGLGQAICHALANAGMQIALGYTTPAKAQTLLPELSGDGHIAVHAPVTDSAMLAIAAARVKETYGRLDLLVNCAGITRFVPHHDLDMLDDALIDEIFAVNVRGVIASTRAMLPLLRAAPSPLIVNISSIAATTAMGSNIAYCASKAAVDNLTRSLARALAPDVRVVSVAPGLVDTEFVKQLDEDWRNDQAGRTPLNRLARPEEIGSAVIAAATSLSFMTGAIIPVDGGRPLG
ncbi:SDR family NAD(P)-dependent oxidoreductase [Aquamicrobium terrae]